MHDVFPKARFRDCIGMTEKVGHQARLRIMRKQWIDDSKPREEKDDEDFVDADGIEVLETAEREGSIGPLFEFANLELLMDMQSPTLLPSLTILWKMSRCSWTI